MINVEYVKQLMDERELTQQMHWDWVERQKAREDGEKA